MTQEDVDRIENDKMLAKLRAQEAAEAKPEQEEAKAQPEEESKSEEVPPQIAPAPLAPADETTDEKPEAPTE